MKRIAAVALAIAATLAALDAAVLYFWSLNLVYASQGGTLLPFRWQYIAAFAIMIGAVTVVWDAWRLAGRKGEAPTMRWVALCVLLLGVVVGARPRLDNVTAYGVGLPLVALGLILLWRALRSPRATGVSSAI